MRIKLSGVMRSSEDGVNDLPAKIVYWYDRSEKSWVTALRDIENNQIGDAEYDGQKNGRDFVIANFRKMYPSLPVEKLKPVSR